MAAYRTRRHPSKEMRGQSRDGCCLAPAASRLHESGAHERMYTSPFSISTKVSLMPLSRDTSSTLGEV